MRPADLARDETPHLPVLQHAVDWLRQHGAYEPDAVMMTDYDTARALIVDRDPAVAMQSFMAGKIRVQGDMMKLMALQTAMPVNEVSEQVADEIAAITS